ncbi:MAG: hypothetical protein ABSA52_15720 [Candidatus Binatia bacterium]
MARQPPDKIEENSPRRSQGDTEAFHRFIPPCQREKYGKVQSRLLCASRLAVFHEVAQVGDAAVHSHWQVHLARVTRSDLGGHSPSAGMAGNSHVMHVPRGFGTVEDRMIRPGYGIFRTLFSRKNLRCAQ